MLTATAFVSFWIGVGVGLGVAIYFTRPAEALPGADLKNGTAPYDVRRPAPPPRN